MTKQSKEKAANTNNQESGKKRSMDLKALSNKKPLMIGVVVCSVFLMSLLFTGGDNAAVHELSKKEVIFEAPNEDMTGIKESVDPRDVWTAKVEKNVSDTVADLKLEIAKMATSKNDEIQGLQQEIELLKKQTQMQMELAKQRELEDSLQRSNMPRITPEPVILKKSKTLGVFNKSYGAKKCNIKDYVASGTFARAVLETGIVVGTGSNTQSNPEPLMLRLTDAGIFSSFGRNSQIKEAILIGDCSGDLSAERARCRLQTISLENYKGEIIEKPVQGWLVDSDGVVGIRGKVVDKSSDMLRMAMLNGVLGGVSSFLQNQSTSGAFPISPITGQQNALSGMSQIKGGMASGAGNAFSKMADFVMERFNSMTPQIAIPSGREVDVVFRMGFDVASVETIEQAGNKPASGNIQQASYYQNAQGSLQQTIQNQQYKSHGADAFVETMQHMNSGIGNGKDRSL